MHKQKSLSKKLPSIRTFASDQKSKTGTSTEKEASADAVSVAETKQVPPAPPKKEIPKKQIPRPIKKIPAPPVVKKEHIVADAPTPSKKSIPKIKSLPIPPKKSSIKKEHIVATPSVPSKESIPKTTSSKEEDSLVTIDNENSSSATIITDTRKDRFNLFSSVIDSIKSWVEEFKVSRKARKTPKYTVPETSRRKGIIQKATSITGKFAVADHSIIHEKIRARRERDETTVSSPTWSANTESVFPLLEETNEPRVSNVQILPRKSFVTKHQEIVITDLKENSSKVAPSIEEEEIEPEEKPSTPVQSPRKETEISTPIVELDIPEEQTPPEENLHPVGPTWETGNEIVSPTLPIPAPKVVKRIAPIPHKEAPPKPPAPKREIQNVVSEASKTSTPKIEKAEKTQPQEIEAEEVNKTKLSHNTTEPSFILTTSTNHLALRISVVILISVAVGAFIFYLYDSKTNTAGPTLKHITSVNTQIQIEIEPDLNIETLTTALDDFKPTMTKQLAFITHEDDTDFVRPSTIFSILDIALVPNFVESISNVYFGKNKNTYTFITLNITDKIVAQGGLLAWEKDIYKDLSPLLEKASSDEPVEVKQKFIDGSLGGIDVRVLKNEDGDEKLIYGFVDKNTVVITTTSFAFGELLELTK